MIDLREIKCSCGQPKCMVGISFDMDEGNNLILRLHDKNNDEKHMRMNKKTVKELIKELQSFYPEAKNRKLSKKKK